MNSTDELRKWAEEFWEFAYSKFGDKAKLLEIADRIDAEYQKAEYEWRNKDRQTWIRGYGECHAELMAGSELIAADLEKAGWVKLPVDADGEVIHIGDKMQMQNDNEFREVVGFYDGGFLAWLNGRYVPCKATLYSHYHAPTVEDLLWELLGKIRPDMEDEEAVPIVKAYAENLRLADDGKEQ